MKKFLVMAVMAIMALGVSAQVYVGGSLGYTHAKTDLGSGDQFTIAPEIGYNLNDSWAIGAGLNYTWVRMLTTSSKSTPMPVTPTSALISLASSLTAVLTSVSLSLMKVTLL